MFKDLVRILRPPHKNSAEDSSIIGYSVYFVEVVPAIFNELHLQGQTAQEEGKLWLPFHPALFHQYTQVTMTPISKCLSF
jgi:hypothetical protein